MTNSKDLIQALKEVLNGKDLKLITEVLKQIKAGVIQASLHQLYGIFFKNSEDPK
jgi:hypothetical protein